MTRMRSTGLLSLTPTAARLLRSPTAGRLLLVVMGVSGCGKSTIGERLGDALHWPFLEGDTLHPASNVARLSAGLPLDDAMRQPWLEAIGAWMEQRRSRGEPGVVACSALKRHYRDPLRDGHDDVCFAWLHVGPAELRRRVSARQHHFMPASLLDSQLAALEPPQPDESAIEVAADGEVDATVQALLDVLEPAARA